MTNRIGGEAGQGMVCVASLVTGSQTTFRGNLYPVDASDRSALIAIAAGVDARQPGAEELLKAGLAELARTPPLGTCTLTRG